jgi:hypothetical protein
LRRIVDLSGQPVATLRQALRAGYPYFTDLLVNQRSINAWLSAPLVDPAAGTQPLGPQTRYYPSLPISAIADANAYQLMPDGSYRWRFRSPAGVYTDPPYTWSTVYRYEPAQGGRVTFVVFVSRRSFQPPVLIQGTTPAPNSPNTFDMPAQVYASRDLPALIAPPQAATAIGSLGSERFMEGSFLVSATNGAIIRVVAVNSTAGVPGVTLSGGADPQSLYWFIPADPSSGRSPVVGVYSRTFLLNP